MRQRTDVLQLQPVPGLLVPGESDLNSVLVLVGSLEFMLSSVLSLEFMLLMILSLVLCGAGLCVDVGEHNVYDNDDSECHVIFILFLVSMFVRSF